MNNFLIGLKRFFTNKNVVTIILVLVILIALYWGYSSSIKKQTKPISLPVAARTIDSETEITSEDVKYIQVANSMVSENVVKSSFEIIGKYTNVNVTIPEGSMFYAEWLANAEDVPGNWIEQLDYEKGELGYYMDVDIESTLGNNVLPNTYIDLYMSAADENGTPMYGKLLKNIKILVVHNSSGENVFGSEIKTPSKIGFAVNQDMYMLLKKAEALNIGFDIAPRGSTVPKKDMVIVTSSTLRDYIDAQTITIEDDVVEEEEEETKEDTTTETEKTEVESKEVVE